MSVSKLRERSLVPARVLSSSHLRSCSARIPVLREPGTPRASRRADAQLPCRRLHRAAPRFSSPRTTPDPETSELRPQWRGLGEPRSQALQGGGIWLRGQEGETTSLHLESASVNFLPLGRAAQSPEQSGWFLFASDHRQLSGKCVRDLRRPIWASCHLLCTYFSGH